MSDEHDTIVVMAPAPRLVWVDLRVEQIESPPGEWRFRISHGGVRDFGSWDVVVAEQAPDEG